MNVQEFIESVLKDAILRAKLGSCRVEKLIENRDEFRGHLVNSMRRCSAPDRFIDEDLDSRYGYPVGYRKSRDISEQITCLLKFFPNLRYVNGSPRQIYVPKGFEGYVAIPRWEALAPTYGDAVEMAIGVLCCARGLGFYAQYDCFGPRYLRQYQKTALAFQTASDQQDSDILIIPGQFGLRHRGRSVRRAREVMSVSEFGLGIFAVAIMLLTHPDRISNYNDLGIDCAGDEFSPSADGNFLFAPYFVFHNGKLKLIMRKRSRAHERFGSASAILNLKHGK